MWIKVLRWLFDVCIVQHKSLAKYYDGGKGWRIHVPQPPAVFPIFGKVSIFNLRAPQLLFPLPLILGVQMTMDSSVCPHNIYGWSLSTLAMDHILPSSLLNLVRGWLFRAHAWWHWNTPYSSRIPTYSLCLWIVLFHLIRNMSTHPNSMKIEHRFVV